MDFCDFVSMKKIEIDQIEAGDPTNTRTIFDKWRAFFKHLAREMYWERVKEDFKMHVNPDQVKTYMESEVARNAIGILENIHSNNE